MAKVRILANTRLNRVFYGRDSILDVSEKEAVHLASIGIAERLDNPIIDEPREVLASEPEQIEQEQPKASKPKSKKAVKK